ncbi:dcn1-like protein [Anaeramoeba flamelloides]|uniref:Defective in cullin neddylation protein n=1 Tax=Anaeramoeba flamelloides TaxID=1746091 RepID=A0ABQ8Y1Y9_9EUKA|nr:dcn1-like protein [Anaeramoeba flamelloides]
MMQSGTNVYTRHLMSFFKKLRFLLSFDFYNYFYEPQQLMNQNKKTKIQNFVRFTCTNKETAQKYLGSTLWNIERAVTQWFQKHPYGQSNGNSDIECLTNNKKSKKKCKRKVNSPNKQNLIKLFEELKGEKSNIIDPEGVQTFFDKIGVDIMDEMALIVSWKLNAKEMGIYTKQEFVENWWKYKAIPVQLAIQLWKIVLPNRFTLLDEWVEFLSQKDNIKLSITRDTWKLLLDSLL